VLKTEKLIELSALGLCACLVACSDEGVTRAPSRGAPSQVAGAGASLGGAAQAGGSTAGGSSLAGPSNGGTNPGGGPATGSGAGGAPSSGSAGLPAASGDGAQAGTGAAGNTTGGAPQGGAAGAPAGNGGAGLIEDTPTHDHCIDGEYLDTRDASLATPSAPDKFTASNGDVDLPLPKAVLDWMDERVWKQSHDAWHNIRRCRGGGLPGGGEMGGSTDVCSHTELVPAHQECADADDGYAFLIMHRHMMIALRQAFPQHADLFDGFPKFPFNQTDVPEAWRSRFGTGWTQQILDVANTLESIETHLDQFATEGDLGKYIQCGTMTNGASSIHGALHFKWVVNESPNSLGKQPVNIGNYMFWRLHGWIDRIWERYRVAKGLTTDEPKLVAALLDQCREMHQLGRVIDPNLVQDNTGPLPVEHGYFHETVRPILEKTCAGCHSESSPEARMSLGGHISSADVIKGLVNVQTFDGGQFLRVVPGHPEQSWLYLKASATAGDAGCMGSTCNTQSMPPGATPDKRLSANELSLLAQWITDGAPAPTP